MENTENTRSRLYIVSFGASDKYRYVYHDHNACDDLLNHPHPLEDVEKEIREYLEKKFPEATTLAYYYSPRLVEVEWDHRDRYEEYPVLTRQSVEQIKELLADEVLNQESQHMLDSNAPESNINNPV